MCAANLITSWPFKIKLINGMAPRKIFNAIPSFFPAFYGAQSYIKISD